MVSVRYSECPLKEVWLYITIYVITIYIALPEHNTEDVAAKIALAITQQLQRWIYIYIHVYTVQRIKYLVHTCSIYLILKIVLYYACHKVHMQCFLLIWIGIIGNNYKHNWCKFWALQHSIMGEIKKHNSLKPTYTLIIQTTDIRKHAIKVSCGLHGPASFTNHGHFQSLAYVISRARVSIGRRSWQTSDGKPRCYIYSPPKG